MPDITIALAGNPNAGKSTIFNVITGLRQHTGNWPGKTVEKKTGTRKFDGLAIECVDLPGTYSLTAYSPDEVVARDYIISEHPDIIICVVDATNLERNLYLVVQMLELGVPVCIALNMTDQARSMGVKIDIEQLSALLGNIPVVPTIASRGEGISQLLAETVRYVKSESGSVVPAYSGSDSIGCGCETPSTFMVDYGEAIEAAIVSVAETTKKNQLPLNGYCSRWLALKLLEGEADVAEAVDDMPGGKLVVRSAKAEAAHLESIYLDDIDIITADRRYSKVSDISRKVIYKSPTDRLSLTERIDHIVTNRLIGLPIFLVIMYLIFRLVIDVSAPYLDWVDNVINGFIATGLSAVLIELGAADWLHSLFIDGIIAGVGGILTFVPGLIALFFFLALLEETGYLARAAFVMDRLMKLIGLHGKSVIPLMLGFGCAVPAIYATRTISNRRNRLLTAMLIPFMSCSARLPVYVVFTLAFFGRQAGSVIWLMYVLGIAVAILLGFIFSRTVLRSDEESAFILELPPYRMPTAKGLAIHTWENTREFVQKAGTVILAISVVLWLLLNLPWGVEDQRESYYGRLSAAVAPALEPAGFGSYETSGALIAGFIAKELVVSTLSQVYVGGEVGEESTGSSIKKIDLKNQLTKIVIGFGQATVDAIRTLLSLLPGINLNEETAVEDTVLSHALRTHFSPLTAIAFLVFVLLYVPCLATLAAIKQEFGGRWATTTAIYQTTVAWLAAILVFQGGSLLGFG